MSTEFNVDLPPRYEYNDQKSVEENLRDIDEYILTLHAALETILRELFIRVSDVAEDATANNIAFVDQDGNVIDSGKDISTDGTLGGDSDNSVPTEKAVKTYVDAQKLNGHVAPDGDVDFNDQEAIDFIVENRTDDTGMTVTGQIWFRTDV